MPLIAIDKLHNDPRNANVCPADVMIKLRSHIERTGLCPTLLVRPNPALPGEFIVVDGHHRKRVVKELGWTEVDCQIKEMTEDEAGILLLTLNRLRGVDIPRKRAELMESLLEKITLEELSLMLPESATEIEGLLALIDQDEAVLEKAIKLQIETEEKTIPVPFGFMVPAEDAPLVQQALAFYQARSQSDQGYALVAICRDALAYHEVSDGPTQA